MKCMKDGVTRAIFDYQGIDVGQASICKSMEGCKSAVQQLKTDLNKNLGNALVVNITNGCKAGDYLNITIPYNTNNESLAINWLKPS